MLKSGWVLLLVWLVDVGAGWAGWRLRFHEMPNTGRLAGWLLVELAGLGGTLYFSDSSGIVAWLGFVGLLEGEKLCEFVKCTLASCEALL